MKKQKEWESLQHIPEKEYLFGCAMIMLALMEAIREIRSISLLLPLSTMSLRQLRKHFLGKAREKLQTMTEEEFAAFIFEHFNSDDFEKQEN